MKTMQEPSPTHSSPRRSEYCLLTVNEIYREELRFMTLAGYHCHGGESSKNSHFLQAGHSLFEDHPCQQYGRCRVKRRDHGGDIDPGCVGSNNEKKVSSEIKQRRAETQPCRPG